MTEQPTEKCKACDRAILPPVDDVTQDYEEFKETGHCKTCRDNPARREAFKNLKNENNAKKIYEEIKEQEQRIAIPLSEYIPEEMSKYAEKLFKEENIYGQIVEKRKLILNDFANYITDNQKHRTFTDSETNITYYWSEKTKTYQTNGELYLNVCAKKLLRERATPAQVKAITELIQYDTISNNFKPSELIAVKNGILKITENNVELLPFSPDILVTTQLPVVYSSEAKSEPWLVFLQQIQPNEEDRLLLQESLGTILLKEDLHYIFWLYGNTGRNGKGTVIRTMFTIFGTVNCSAVSVTEMDGNHPFALYEMTNSLMNVSPEPPIERSLAIQLLQSLTGGDAISIERKGIQTRPKHTFFTKQFVMGNFFPRVLKATEAFYERMIFINFPNSFTGEKQIVHIEKQWLGTEEDRSAILNWLIEGTQRVLKNNKKIKKPKSQKDMELNIKRASDTIGAFVIQGIERADIHSYVPKRDIQPHYKRYCELNDFQPDRKAQRLNEEIAQIIGVKAGSKNINGDKTKVWFGLKLKNLDASDDDMGNMSENTLDCYNNGESGTTGTAGTSIFAVKIAEKNENNSSINGGSTGSTGSTDSCTSNNGSEVVEGYSQLVCVFCQKGIMDNDWTNDDFSWNKPAHKLCYDVKRSELAVHDKGEGF